LKKYVIILNASDHYNKLIKMKKERDHHFDALFYI